MGHEAQREQGAAPGSLGVIFSIVALDLIGFGLLIPQLGVYAVKFGASPLSAALLLSVYSLMQLLFAPWLGRLSDRYGRRPVLLVSLAGSLAGYVLFAFAHSLPLLFVSRVVDGVSGANIATAQAYVADVTRPEERARGMARIGMAFGLGFVLGPALGAQLGYWGGNLAIGLFAASLSGLNLVWAFLRLPESRREDSAPAPQRTVRGASGLLRLPVVGAALALFLLFLTAFAQMEGTFSVFVLSRFLAQGPVALEAGGGGLFALHARAPEALLREASLRTGYLFAFVGVLSAALQGLYGRMAARGRRRHGGRAGPGEAGLAVVGLAGVTLGLALLPLAPSYALLFLPMALLALGSALVNPSLSALVSLHAPAGRQGEALGAFQAFGSLGRILGPALGGLLFTQAGPSAPYAVAAALCLVATGAALLLLGRVRMGGARRG
ncbi:MFS transporter [Aggregicoccus sp. 17bor-14]|uniref:MFS transporter n=1 Tax=Myxococcaceae TaxID=31 RepID=UPI0012F01025|nr:MFS transporter [Simulacricoccus sp. 17bor-14]MRI90679.1 MFS transporter [Aggregicoccus sp. 17bor-14]